MRYLIKKLKKLCTAGEKRSRERKKEHRERERVMRKAGEGKLFSELKEFIVGFISLSLLDRQIPQSLISLS